jgi:hypothetical protein
LKEKKGSKGKPVVDGVSNDSRNVSSARSGRSARVADNKSMKIAKEESDFMVDHGNLLSPLPQLNSPTKTDSLLLTKLLSKLEDQE